MPPDHPRPRRPPRCYAEEAPPFHLPDWLWGPLGSGVLILIPGALALAFRQPWLFPSLAPSSYTHVTEPHRNSARLYNTIVGQFIAVGVGYLCAWLFAVDLHATVSGGVAPVPPQVWASAAGLALMAFFQWLFSAAHPPAGATLMLITLGEFKLHPHDAGSLLVGILIMALAGEAFRRLRMKQVKCE